MYVVHIFFFVFRWFFFPQIISFSFNIYFTCRILIVCLLFAYNKCSLCIYFEVCFFIVCALRILVFVCYRAQHLFIDSFPQFPDTLDWFLWSKKKGNENNVKNMKCFLLEIFAFIKRKKNKIKYINVHCCYLNNIFFALHAIHKDTHTTLNKLHASCNGVCDVTVWVWLCERMGAIHTKDAKYTQHYYTCICKWLCGYICQYMLEPIKDKHWSSFFTVIISFFIYLIFFVAAFFWFNRYTVLCFVIFFMSTVYFEIMGKHKNHKYWYSSNKNDMETTTGTTTARMRKWKEKKRSEEELLVCWSSFIECESINWMGRMVALDRWR